jgi:cobalamin biosynthesis protein CobT
MKKLGHDIDSPEDIEDIADKKIAKEQPEVLIRLKTNGEYQNVIVLKKTEKDEEEPVEDDEDEDEKEVEEDEDEEEEETEAKDSDEDEEEEKPASKKVEKKKAPKEEVEEDEEEEEESEDEDEDEEKASDDAEPELEVGQTLLVKVDDKEFKAKLLEIVEERKDGTGIVRVKSLKDGKKYRIEVPDDVVEIVK